MNDFLRNHPLKAFSASLGVMLLVAFIVLPQLLILQLSNKAADSVSENAAFVHDVRVTGSASTPHHPFDERIVTFTREVWSWNVARELTLGQDGYLKVTRTIEKHRLPLHIARAQGLLGESPGATKSSESTSVTSTSQSDVSQKNEGLHVKVEGDFQWHSSQAQLMAPDSREWSWLFTANRRGSKGIQLILPPVSDTIRWQRPSSTSVTETKLDSRFIYVPVKVTGLFGLSEEQEATTKLLGRFFGCC